jgi:dihydroorotase
MSALIVENARIVDPASGRDGVGALRVEDGRIAGIESGGAPGMPERRYPDRRQGAGAGARTHRHAGVHRRAGARISRNPASAGEAAAAGGVTSFVAMPDTLPVIDDGALIDYLLRRAQGDVQGQRAARRRHHQGARGEEITEFGLLKEAGAVCFSDGRHSIQSSALLRAALTYAANFDMPVVHHPRDNDLAGDGVMNEGLFATIRAEGHPGRGRDHPAGPRPAARGPDRGTLPRGADFHGAQRRASWRTRSSAGNRRHRGVSINNLSLNENDVGAYRTFFKLNPPLRAEDDRRALVEGSRRASSTSSIPTTTRRTPR